MPATMQILNGPSDQERNENERTGPAIYAGVLLEQSGGPLAVGQVSVPRLGPGQVLVRMAAAPINPSDLGFIQGSYGFQKPFPVVPGFEGSCIVVAAGPGLLSRLWMGKRAVCSVPQGGIWAAYLVTQATRCIALINSEG